MVDVNRSLLRVVREDRAPNESTLMKRVAKGDEHAFSVLYDRVSAMAFGVVVQVVRDRAMAEDVTQEVFVEVWRVATRYDRSKGTVQAWIATIAHRKAVDRVRSEQSRRDREDRDHHRSHSPPIDAVVTEHDRMVERDQVQDALETLTDKQREAVTMAYFGGRTYQEVAVMLDVPEGTVKTRIRDGLIKLRDGIGRPQ